MATPAPKKTSLSREESSRALQLVRLLEQQPEAYEFLHPVDFKGLGLHDYPLIIKTPMDLSTVKKNIKAGTYATLEEAVADLSMIWDNCRTYNMINSPITHQADVMERYMRSFCQKFKIPCEIREKKTS
mmetsp:Transcript_25033/g.43938  ORF Transcript_25033/g.43938 Transcript_25033/m.43938 type:complete len:129 (+) Transcript_25033:1-387(+)